jgi:MoaA/NifB/PqqE/SkfB family radical SAM enzyme
MPGKIGAGMTVCSLNYDKITEVYDFLKDLGIYFAVNVMDISELYYQNTTTKFTGMLPTEEMKETMIEQMNQVRTNQPTWKNLQIKLLRGIREDFDCYSGRLQVFIHNSGRIYPCIYMDRAIESLQLGSLKTCSVEQINMQDCRKCLTHCEAMPSVRIAKRRQIFLEVFRNKIRGLPV